MLRLCTVAVALAAASLAAPGPIRAASPTVDGLSLGQLELVMPEGDPQGLVFLFSDEAGPTAELTQAATQLATLGLIVAPVALRPFLDRQDIPDQDCLYLVSDIEEASRRIQAAGGRGH